MTDRMTAGQFKASTAKPASKGRVRGTIKTTVNGIKFDSKLEAKRYVELKDLEDAGEICNLELQVPIPLFGARAAILTPTARHMTYRADFRYVDWRIGGVVVVEDAKGWATDVYKIKKAILKAQGIDITEYPEKKRKKAAKQ